LKANPDGVAFHPQQDHFQVVDEADENDEGGEDEYHESDEDDNQ